MIVVPWLDEKVATATGAATGGIGEALPRGLAEAGVADVSGDVNDVRGPPKVIDDPCSDKAKARSGSLWPGLEQEV
jgi:hypothetical protein